jgi:hypothetical protein
VGGGEEGKGYLEADTEQGVELEGEVVTEVAESADLRFVGGYGRGDGLLGFAVDELAKVEGSGLLCKIEGYR